MSKLLFDISLEYNPIYAKEIGVQLIFWEPLFCLNVFGLLFSIGWDYELVEDE